MGVEAALLREQVLLTGEEKAVQLFEKFGTVDIICEEEYQITMSSNQSPSPINENPNKAKQSMTQVS